MPRRLNIAISNIANAIVLGLVAWFVAAPSIADDKSNDKGSHESPDAIWSVPKVDVSIKPGETQQIQVTLTAHEDLDVGVVRVVPTLVPYLQVTPTTTPKLRKGDTQVFTLVFSTMTDALPMTTDGVLQLRETKRKKGENRGLGELVAKPLPVSVRVVWSQATVLQGSMTFSYLTLGQPSTLTSSTEPDGITFASVRFDTVPISGITQYSIALVPNPSRQTLLQWFSSNIDVSGSIVSGAGYSTGTLANGVQWLQVSLPIPTVHLEQGERIAILYGMTADQATAIAIHLGHENAFSLLGLLSEQRVSLFRALLESLSVQ